MLICNHKAVINGVQNIVILHISYGRYKYVNTNVDDDENTHFIVITGTLWKSSCSGSGKYSGVFTLSVLYIVFEHLILLHFKRISIVNLGI